VGISDWRAKRHMKDPVRGSFRVTDWYDNHLSGRICLTGVITAPGIPATAAEHTGDLLGRWSIGDELPVLVDRADLARCVILWDEVTKPAVGDRLKQSAREKAQQEADMLNNQPRDGQPRNMQPGQWGVYTEGPGDSTPIVLTSSGTMNISNLPPNVAGQVQDVLNAFRGQLGGQGAPGTAAPPHGGFNPIEAAQFLASGAGERASAVVTSVTNVPSAPGALAAPGGQADLTLEITRSDGSIYMATTQVAFSSPERRASIATLGTRLSVRIDPARPSRVVIEPPGRS
jgi:hypothetical protein